MRLTNTMRTAFIKSAMEDVPYEEYAESVRNLVYKDAVDSLPPKARKMHDDKETRDYMHTVYWQGNYKISGISNVSVPAIKGTDKYKPSYKLKEILNAIYTKADMQNDSRDILRQELTAAAYSVNTRKALVDLLPEFEKYLPIDAAAAVSKNVPAIANIMINFVKAGWPKKETK